MGKLYPLIITGIEYILFLNLVKALRPCKKHVQISTLVKVKSTGSEMYSKLFLKVKSISTVFLHDSVCKDIKHRIIYIESTSLYFFIILCLLERRKEGKIFKPTAITLHSLFTREKEGRIFRHTAITLHSLFTRGDKRLLSLALGINKVEIFYSMEVRRKEGGRKAGRKGGMKEVRKKIGK